MNVQRGQRAVLAALLALVAADAAAALTAVEQQIVAAVKERSAAALQFLERTVNVNSGTLNPEGVREVGRMFRAEFDQLGFTTRWVDLPPAVQRAGHLVAAREGKQGKRLLLIGHLDTVFEKDSPVQRWERKGDRIRGPGVSDMKGGDVIIVEALRALARLHALDNTSITVVFTGDEEKPGSPLEVTRAELVSAAKRSDLALGFEGIVKNKQGKDTATIGRRAASGWMLTVTGKPGHSSGVFSESSGFGAIYEGARILNAFREQVAEPDLTFNAGAVVGGTEVSYDPAVNKGSAFGKTNVIAASFRAQGDLRYLTYEQRDRAHARMRAIVAKSLPGAKAEITFSESYPPMSPTPGNLRLLEAYSQASVDAGLGVIEALPPGQRGAGDVQFVAPYVACLDGIGASGDGSHTNDEDLEPGSIERATIRAALLIYRLTR